MESKLEEAAIHAAIEERKMRASDVRVELEDVRDVMSGRELTATREAAIQRTRRRARLNEYCRMAEKNVHKVSEETIEMDVEGGGLGLGSQPVSDVEELEAVAAYRDLRGAPSFVKAFPRVLSFFCYGGVRGSTRKLRGPVKRLQ